MSHFVPVADDDYEDDPTVGARIGARALHVALQHALDVNAAAFHVHLHDHRGMPGFSATDRRELTGLMRPFAVLVPEQPHGVLILSQDYCVGLVWHRGDKQPTRLVDVTVVGAPITLQREEGHR